MKFATCRPIIPFVLISKQRLMRRHLSAPRVMSTRPSGVLILCMQRICLPWCIAPTEGDALAISFGHPPYIQESNLRL
jgi:hypothetical protein